MILTFAIVQTKFIYLLCIFYTSNLKPLLQTLGWPFNFKGFFHSSYDFRYDSLRHISNKLNIFIQIRETKNITTKWNSIEFWSVWGQICTRVQHNDLTMTKYILVNNFYHISVYYHQRVAVWLIFSFVMKLILKSFDLIIAVEKKINVTFLIDLFHCSLRCLCGTIIEPFWR